MRVLAPLAILLALFALPARADEPKKEAPLPCSVDKLDKEWGLKLKSATVRDNVYLKAPVRELVVTLEFTKDVTDAKAVRKAFESSILEGKPVKDRPPHVLFYLFDEDNVSIGKLNVVYIEGEITGKSGDAFRVTVRTYGDTLKKAKKVDLRMSEKD